MASRSPEHPLSIRVVQKLTTCGGFLAIQSICMLQGLVLTRFLSRTIASPQR